MNISDHVFASAEQKIERAREHINDFKEKSSQFLRRCRKVVIYDDVGAGQRSIRMIGEEPIPSTFGPIIGDAVQNLRSALDHVIWELISPSNPSNPRAVQYPFVEYEEQLESAIRARQLDVVGSSALKIIRDSHPYSGGDGDLYALHQLGIADRHKLDIKSSQIMRFGPMNLQDIDPSAPSITFTDGIQLIGEMRWPLHNMNRQQRRAAGVPANGEEVDVALDFVFGKDEPLDGMVVVTALEEISVKVKEIIEKFKLILPIGID